MEPTSPPKSQPQPLHNFDLPLLKWITTSSSSEGGGGHHQRRRSVKSPSARPGGSSSASSARQPPPPRDSIPPPPPPPPLPPLGQSPLRESAALPLHESPIRGDIVVKHSPVRGESPRPSPARDSHLKNSPVDRELERLSSIREDALRQFVTGSEAWAKQTKAAPIVYRGKHSRYSSSSSMKICSSSAEKAKEKVEEKMETKLKAAEDDLPPAVKKSKILIKIPNMSKKLKEENAKEEALKMADDSGTEKKLKEEGKDKDVEFEAKIPDDVDDEIKIWNLRPRKPKFKTQNAAFGAFGAEYGNVSGNTGKAKKTESPLKKANKSGEKDSNHVDGAEEKEKDKDKDKEKKEKKGKKKLSIFIALTKEEIEEDIYAFTGSKPSRRPKKRAKNIQKKVDAVFPGLGLVSITPESYKVSENYMKG
ncbi:hypothetical protein STAS_07160 [Striga asiatica]|uniref:Uncharacterized protein n=1 Tax=Striga asiatica TaxID=4170 RepID=A0A5A7PF40_STRAF|nr:hypothetical protein STAS_07160 [Striga asiatica]